MRTMTTLSRFRGSHTADTTVLSATIPTRMPPIGLWMLLMGLLILHGQAAAIPIENASFETPVLGDGKYLGGIAGWETVTGGAYVLNPVNSWFPNSTDPSSGMPDGKQCGYVCCASSASQTLTATLRAGHWYTLSVSVGLRSDMEAVPYAVELWAGNTLLGSASPPMIKGEFILAMVEYCAASNDPMAGQPLKIVLSQPTHVSGGAACFDNISLDETPHVVCSAGAPSVTLQPSPVSVLPGQTANLIIGVEGECPMTFQWYRNGDLLQGATDPRLTVTAAKTSDTGDYYVLIANAQGEARSATVRLDVTALRAYADNEMLISSTPLTRPDQSVITLTSELTGGSIFYTTDGTAPTFASTRYQAPFTITASTSIRAITYSADFTESQQAGPFEVRIVPGHVLVLGASGQGTVLRSPALDLYAKGTVVTLTASPEAGWRFREWIRDATGTDLTATVQMDADRNVAAVFDPVPTVSLTTFTAGGGTIEGNAAGAWELGAVAELSAVPSAGWEFMRWQGDASGNDPILQLTMDRDRAIEAVFGTTLNTTAVGGGHVQLTPATELYPYGSKILAIGKPEGGNYLVTWGGAGSGSANPLLFTVSEPNQTLSAAFAAVPAGFFLLTVDIQGEGLVSLSPAQNIFAAGQTVRIAASSLPESGYAFEKWSGDAIGEEPSVEVIMDANKTVTASFIPGFSLQVTLEGPGIVTRTPDLAVYKPGQSVIVGVAAETGWTLQNWSGDAEGSDNPLSLIMTSSKSVTATLGAFPGVKRWEFVTGSSVTTAPAVGDDGTVYVGSNDRKVYALDGLTGAKRWEFVTGGAVTSSPAIGADGTIYVGSNDRKVYAVDRATGQKRWAFLTGGYVSSTPAIAPDGTVYLGSYDKKLYALDGVTGQKRWEFPTAGEVLSSPAIGSDGTVYLGSNDKKVYALDGITGAQRWEFLTGAAVASSPAIGVDGTIFVGSNDRRVYALDWLTGQKRWEFLTGTYVHSSPAVGADGTVFVASGDRKVYALNGATGQKRWEFLTAGNVSSTPAIAADGAVYVGSFDGKVYALQGATGQKRWEFLTAGSVQSSPAIGPDGTVYVGSNDGKIYAITGTAPLAESAWPTFHKDPRHTGCARPNQPPVIGELADVTVAELTSVEVACIAADADGSVQKLSWSLTSAPEGASIDPTTGWITWVPTEAQGPGTYTLTVEVTDNGVPPLSHNTSFMVTVLEVNSSPTLASEQFTVDEGAVLKFTLSGGDSDVPAQSLTYDIVSGPAGANVDPATGQFHWQTGPGDGGQLIPIQISVTDSGEPPLSTVRTFLVAVRAANEAQVVLHCDSIRLRPAMLTQGTVEYGLEATTAGEGIINDEIGVGDEGSDAHQTVLVLSDSTVAEPARLDCDIGVPDPGDSNLNGISDFFEVDHSIVDFASLGQFLFTDTAGSHQGSIDMTWNRAAGEASGTCRLRLRIEDIGMDLVFLHVFEIYDYRGTFTYIPGETDLAGTLTLVRMGAAGNLHGTLPLTRVDESQLAFSAFGLTDDFDKTIEFASSADTGSPLMRTALQSDYCAGLYTIDGRTETPTVREYEHWSLYVVEAADSDGDGIPDLSDEPVPVGTPLLVPIADHVIDELSLLSLTAAAFDPDGSGDTLGFSLVDPPPGAVIDPVTGDFQWTPSEAQGPGVFSIVVRVTDDSDPPLSAQQKFTVTVAEVDNGHPAIAAVGQLSVDESQPLTIADLIVDPDIPPSAVTVTLLQAPEGMLYDEGTRSLVWTPSETQGGSTFTVTIKVTEQVTPQYETESSFSISVNKINNPPVLSHMHNWVVNAGYTVTFTVTATDSDLPAQDLHFSLADAPAGAVIDPISGLFNWTAEPGIFTITIEVTDDGTPPISAAQAFTIATQGSTSGDAIVNGGFEEPAITSYFLEVKTAQNTIPGWAVVSGSVDIVRQDNNQWLDLCGSAAGEIQQAIIGSVGVGVLSFTSKSASATYRAQVLWNDQSLGIVQHSVTGTPAETTFEIVATGNDILRFKSLTGGNGGVYLDNVTLASASTAVICDTGAPVFTSEPSPTSMSPGQNAVFALSVSGECPMTFQWYRNGEVLPGATEPELPISGITGADAGDYYVEVANALGAAISQTAALRVFLSDNVICYVGPPVVTTGPLSASVPLGDSVTLVVGASGKCPMAFQWYRNGEAVSGATDPTLSIASVQVTDAGDYHVEIANALGSSVSASASLRVRLADEVICHNGEPVVAASPQSVIVWPSQTATLRVSVEGQCPISFQWYRNSEALMGASEPVLTIPNVQIGDLGDYHVEVANALGSSLSESAELRFYPDASPLVEGFAQGTWRNDYSGWIGCLLQVGDSPLQLRSLGRVCASGNTDNHLLRLVRVSDGIVVATATWNPAGGVNGEIKYEALGTPVVLAANTQYRLASQEISGGDSWYSYNTTVTTTDAATVLGAVQSNNGITWQAYGQPGSYSFGPLSLEYYDTTQIVCHTGAPCITLQPSSHSVSSGQAVALSVGVFGNCPMSFQWYRNGELLTDVTQPTLTIAAIEGAHAGDYSVEVSNDHGVALSQTVALRVLVGDDVVCHAGPPVLTDVPSSTGVSAGENVTLDVGVIGECPMSFQWYHNGNPVAGATESTLIIPNVQVTDAGDYHVTVANARGSSVSASAAVRIILADQVVCHRGEPVVTTHPQAATVRPLQSATFRVAVQGECPMSFQWYQNGNPVTGATEAALTIPNVRVSEAGDYYVGIANSLGSAASAPVALRVLLGDDVLCHTGEPVIASEPQAATVWAFQSVTFRVAMQGECPMSFQWYRDSEALMGVTEPVLTIPNVQVTDVGDYHVEVSNARGSSISTSAALAVRLGTPLVEKFAKGTWRNDYSGWVGCLVQVGASPLEIRALGRLYASGNTANHVLRLVRVSDGVVVAAATWNPAGGVNGQIHYEALKAPVVLAPNTPYRLVSQEVSGGDSWYSYNTEVTTTDAATMLGSVRSTDGATWQVVGTAGSYSYGPVSFMYDAGQPEIEVRGNDVIIADGDTVPQWADHTDWGSTAVGFPLRRTFIVRNHGTASLTVAGLAVPTGYTVSEPLAESFAPGTEDTFTVQLEAAVAGTYAGELSLNSSDSDENPFSFRITASVVSEDMAWQTLASGAGVALWGVEWGGGTFVAVGGNGKILNSPDGILWTAQTSMTANTLWGLEYAEGRFVVAGHNGTLLTSTDGASWTAMESGVTAHLTDGAYGNGRFVVVGTGATILTSADGLAPWQRQTVATTQHIQDITYGGGYFVASGTGGLVATSVDGLTWTVHDAGTTAGVPASGYAHDKWWVGGGTGIILGSPDRVTWTSYPSGVSTTVDGFGYGHGRLCAVGGTGTGMDGGFIVLSRDGLAWERAFTGVIPTLYDIAFDGETWVAVGEGGAVVRSERLLPPWELAVGVTGEGTVQRVPDQALYAEGTLVTLTASAADGWQFAGWSGDLASTDNPAQVVMGANRDLTAIFEVRVGAPVMAAVSDQVLDEGGLLFLGLEASDPDLPAQQLAFGLVSGPAGAVVDPATGALTWQTDENHGGQQYTFEVRVSDSSEPPLTDTTSFSVTVLEANSSPVLAAIPDVEGTPGKPVQLQFSATDSDVPLNTLQFQMANAPDGASLDPVTGICAWVPVEPKGDQTIEVTVTVQDNGDPVLTDSKSFNALVRATPPIVTLESPLAGETSDERAALAGTVTDNVGVTAVEWEWNSQPMGALALTGDRFEADGLELKAGLNVFRVLARDAAGNQGAAEVTATWTPLRTLAAGSSPAVQEGLRLNVPVELTSGGDVGSLNFILRYDPASLSDPQWAWGAALSAASTAVNTNVLGEVRATFSLGGAALAAGAVGLAEVDFRARSVPATLASDIVPEVLDVGDPQGNKLVFGTHTEHGQVTINPRTLLGDNNGNDRLDVGDGTLIQRLLTGLNEVRPWDVTGNDLNTNTELDSGDVTRLLRVIVGIDPPPGGLAGPASAQGRSARRAVGLMGPNDEALLLVAHTLSAEVGQRVKVQLVLTNLQGAIVGAFFKMQYPANALRVPDAAAHVSGSMVPSGALTLWNLVPDGDYANQTGTLAFVASSTSAWPGTDGVIAEVEFEVQPGAAEQPEWTIRLVEIEVSANGFDNRALPDADARFALPNVNTAPVLTGIPDQTMFEGTALSVTAVATDADVPSNTLTYSLVTAQEGAAIDPVTGSITWTPAEVDGPGQYTFTVRVTDSGTPPLGDEQTFTVTVNEVNAAPELGMIGDHVVVAGDLVEVHLSATDVDEPKNTLAFELVSGPAGATLDAVTGLFRWQTTLADAGLNPEVAVKVTDNGEPPLGASTSFTVTVGQDMTWQTLASGAGVALWGVEWGGDTFVAVGASGKILSSPDGIVWTEQTSPTGNTLWGLEYAQGRFVVAGHNGTLLTSTDGASWTAMESGVTTHLTDAAYGSGRFVVVGTGATILTSIDGLAPWQIQAVATTKNFQDITYGGGYFVASGTGGLVATSADGLTWTVHDAGTTAGVPASGYAYDKWWVGGGAGLILGSPDRVTWTSYPSGVSTTVDGFGYGHGRLCAVGGSGTGMNGGFIVLSRDGLAWERAFTGVIPTLYDIAFDGETWVAVGEGGAVVRSERLLPPWELAVGVTGEGTVQRVPDQALYAEGTLVTLTASAAGGWVFAGWSGDLEGTENPAQVVMDGDQAVTALFSAVNRPPALAAIANQTINEGAVLAISLQASDPDLPAQNLTYALLNGPAGAAVDPATGELTWQTDENNGGQQYTFEVRVTDDGVPPLSADRSFTVTVTEVNSAPELAAIPDQTIPEGTVLSVTAIATDADLPGDVLTFSLLTAPDGATINAQTGVITWPTSEPDGPGVYSFTVQVFDNGDPARSDEQGFQVTVLEVNAPPTLASITDQSAAVGQLLAVPLQAADSDVPANQLMFELVQAPSGAAIDPAARLLQWTPAIADMGVHSITVKVVDDGQPALEASRQFSVTVENYLEISAELAGPELLIRFPTITGARYRVEAATDLTEPVWQTLVAEIIGAGSTRTVAVSISAGQPHRFYRVIQLP